MTIEHTATLISGVPSINKAVFHAIRLDAHDPASLIVTPDGNRRLVLRDVELQRAKKTARADEVFCYEDFTPDKGLSGDREIRAAQATAECLRRMDVARVTVDRTANALLIDELEDAGITVILDRKLGVRDRRSKDEEEIAAMREATRVTEAAIRMACETIGGAQANAKGELVHEGEVLTAERVKAMITAQLAANGCFGEHHIVACGREGGDCHNPGTGVLETGKPIIVDVFPKHLETGYYGDCTRSVVHGEVPEGVSKMMAAVTEAKAAGIAATKAGVTGEDVHRATVDVIEAHDFQIGFPPEGAPESFCSMPHGTGHGLGLDLKEPPLLDFKGPELVVGDAVTIEPGLYSLAVGGVRLEDLVIVTEDGCENLNTLPEGLSWA